MTKRAMTRNEAKAYRSKKAASAVNKAVPVDAWAKRALEGGSIICSCTSLQHINDQSIACGYNRNINYDEFIALYEKSMRERGMWSGERDTYVLLRPLMIHEHKYFRPCEKHVRASIYTEDAEGIGDFIIIDVRLEDWMLLLKSTEIWNEEYARRMA